MPDFSLDGIRSLFNSLKDSIWNLFNRFAGSGDGSLLIAERYELTEVALSGAPDQLSSGTYGSVGGSTLLRRNDGVSRSNSDERNDENSTDAKSGRVRILMVPGVLFFPGSTIGRDVEFRDGCADMPSDVENPDLRRSIQAKR